jgi:hypothetical protein
LNPTTSGINASQAMALDASHAHGSQRCMSRPVLAMSILIVMLLPMQLIAASRTQKPTSKKRRRRR